jgi:hypothetical protein
LETHIAARLVHVDTVYYCVRTGEIDVLKYVWSVSKLWVYLAEDRWLALKKYQKVLNPDSILGTYLFDDHSLAGLDICKVLVAALG